MIYSAGMLAKRVGMDARRLRALLPADVWFKSKTGRYVTTALALKERAPDVYHKAFPGGHEPGKIDG